MIVPDNIKKVLKIVIICLLVIIVADFAFYRVEINKIYETAERLHIKNVKVPGYFENRMRFNDETTIDYYKKYVKNKKFRPPSGLQYNSRPIWMFGCSFVYGVDMSSGDPADNETFPAKLSAYAQRPVYNFAYSSWGLQHMLYLLREGDLYIGKKPPEYVIFTFIADHARRVNKIVYDFWSDGAYLRYKEVNGELVEDVPKFQFLWKLTFVKAFLTYLDLNVYNAQSNRDKNFDKVEKLFIASKQEIAKHYPDTKFVIIVYEGNDGFDDWFVKTDRWNELRNRGFIVLSADKLTGVDLRSPEFLASDNYHPNAHAWDVLVPALSKQLSLK